jgi:hypothetical protein
MTPRVRWERLGEMRIDGSTPAIGGVARRITEERAWRRLRRVGW